MGKAMIVGAGAAVTALTGMAVKSAEATDRIDKMSLKLGLSRKGFQEWDYILSQNGVSIDSLQGGLKTLTNMTDGLRRGTSSSAEAFGRLGLSMNDIDGKSQEEVFSMVVNRLQGMESQSERAALANQLLGRSGSELAPLLDAGADSAENLRNRAHELGLVLSDDTVDAGVKLTDTMDDAKRAFGAIATQIGAEVMPLIQKFLEWVISHMPEIKAVMSGVFNAIGGSIQWVIDNSNWLIPVLGVLFGAFAALKVIGMINTLMLAFKTVQLAVAAAGGVMNAVLAANPLTLIVIAIAAVIAGIVALIMNFDKVKAAALSLWNKLKEYFGKIKEFIGGIFDSFRNIIKLPKLEVTGSLNPVKWLTDGLPKLSVKWNAEGAIFKKPTIFDTRLGGQGVGDSTSPEVVAPLNKLQDMIDWNNTQQQIDYDRLADSITKALRGFGVVLDDREVGRFVDTRIIKGVM